MLGLLSALEGFCVIGIVIGTGYVAARMRIGGPTAQMVLNRFSFFVSSPCLMFAILSKERIFEIFHSSIVGVQIQRIQRADGGIRRLQMEEQPIEDQKHQSDQHGREERHNTG